MNMKEACGIVYAGLENPQIRCAKEINESQLGAGETMSQSDLEEIITKHFPLNQVAELNARLGVEHNRTVDAERKNRNLLAEVQRLTVELNSVTNGEYTKQDVELEKLRAALGDVLRDCHSIWMDTPAVKKAQDVYEREQPNISS